MRFTKRIQDLPLNKNGERQLEPHHLDDNFAAQDDALLSALAALFASGGVAAPGTVTLTGLAVRVQGRTGVTLDGRVPLHVDDQTVDLTPLAAGKGLIVMTTDPVTVQRPYTDVVTGESLTDTMNLSAGRLSVIGAGQQGVTLDSNGYPVAPSNTVPVAQVTRTAGGATLDGTPAPGLTIRAGVAGNGVTTVNGKTGAVVLAPADIGAAATTDLAAKADLVGGKVPSSQLPSIPVGQRFTVATQAAMLALAARLDDITVRTDLTNHRFLLTGNPATLADWLDLDAGAATGGAVSSVNGYTGSVVLAAADVRAAPAALGVPAGGAVGQVVTKTGTADGATGWATPNTGAAPGGLISLRFAAPAPVVVPRNPAPASTTASLGALTIYGSYTPASDTPFYGLRDSYQAAGGKFILKIWNANTSALLAASAETTADASGLNVQLPSPVTLLAGVAYYIGVYSTNGTAYATTPTPGTYAGYTFNSYSLFTTQNTGSPSGGYGGGAYYPSWNLLGAAGAAIQKGTVNALDPIDFPVVTDPALLAVNSVAMLDNGTAAPRLIRKRSDGTIWYGPIFSTTP